MDKKKVFEKELGWIVNPKIKAFAEKLVECAPEYFFEVAASSSGRFHPSYALGPGGLVRHTKAATHIMHELFGLEMFDKYSQDQKDMMITAIMAHDFFKHGLESTLKEKHSTVAEHPVVCSQYIKDNAELRSMIEPEQIDFICGCIASHMGQWSTDYRTKREILPKPKTGPQNMVHLADYLASRKYLTFEFGDEYYEPQKDEPVDAGETEELEKVKRSIVDLCKAKMVAGVDQKKLYGLIAEHNGGNRNPNSITDAVAAATILLKLEELNV